MNHFLVKVLGFLNGAIAVAIVVMFAVLGDSWGSRVEATQSHAGALLGSLLGLVVGLVIATIVCGLLAIAISIEKSLKHLAQNRGPSELKGIEESLKHLATKQTHLELPEQKAN
jgi:hypothetical protein